MVHVRVDKYYLERQVIFDNECNLRVLEGERKISGLFHEIHINGHE